MFEKLLSLLPYNPGLAQQLNFYARRMREETAIRRSGMVFIVLAFFVQFFAVLSPPAVSGASANNNLLVNGFTSAADAKSNCANNTNHYKDILTYYGISCAAVGNATTTTIYSHDHNSNVFSMGYQPFGSVNPNSGSVTDELPVNIPGAGKAYVRLLSSFDTGANKTGKGSSYQALQLKNSAGVTFWLLYGCGNLATVGPPQPVPTVSLPPPDLHLPTVPPPTPIKIPTPAPKPPTPNAQPPPLLGINAATCTGGLSGWASENIVGSTSTQLQLAENNEIIKVDVFVDGPRAAGGVFIGEVTNGGHGYPGTNPSWSLPIPAAYQNTSHSFWVYAVNTDGTYTGPGISGSGAVYGADPITSTPCVAPTPPPTPPTPTPPPATCPFDNSINATDAACVVCPYNSLITLTNDQCKPCQQSQSSQDAVACIAVHKTASNVTTGVANADGTTAKAGDVINYTLYAENNGKATVKQFVFEEQLGDVLAYADVSDLHGGTLDSNGQMIWPAVDIAAGATATVQVTVKIKDPIPQTPPSAINPNLFDLIMTNTYGNTINIHLPGSPTATVTTAATSLPNTGPGTGLFIASVVLMIAGYFYARARLLARESVLALQNTEV